MYEKIIVGYNDGDESRDALALGKLLAKTTGAQLVLTGVFPYGPNGQFATAAVLKAAHEAETELAEKIEEAAKEAGAEAEAFPSGSPARGLHDAVEELGADLVVVGSSSRAGVNSVLAGNVALQLLHGSPCAVAVAPKGFRDTAPSLRTIAVGVNDSKESHEALSAAIELGRASHATLRLLSAVNAGAADEFGWGYGQHNWAPTLRAAMEETLEAAADEVPDELEAATELIEGDVATSLSAEANDNVDLLVVGSRAFGPVRRVLLGSVSSALVKSSRCPVLVVPRGTHTAADEVDRTALATGAV